MNSKKKTIIISVLTTVFTGLLIYAAYSLWYIFYGTDSGADVHLYTVLSGIALGWYLMLFIDGVFKKSGKVAKILAFIAGNGFFHGLIWGLNAKINQTNTENDRVIIKTFTITFALTAILSLIALILRAKKKYKILNIILAVIYFAVSSGGLLVLNKENIKALEYKKNIRFGTISAAEMNVTESEKKLCADWSAEHLKDKSESYPFTFKVDGESFNPTEWEKSVSPAAQAKYKGGNTEILTLTNKAKALEVKAEITSFENNATCQWTVYIKNTGSGNSGVISDFYALDSSFNTGKTDLYYSMGSDTAASDFSLIKKKLGSAEKAFSGTDGKPTEKYLPYFNLCGEECGMMLGVGWTGQWAATFSQTKGTTDIIVRQENLEAYLLPGEEIRSPLVSVTFYDNANPLKGFNMFRSWISDCVYPENVTKDYYTVMEVAGPTSERTTDEIIEILDGLDESVYQNSDAFWMDAGWYEYNEGWHDGVGNWTVDTKRYDNGISELSGYAAKKGLGHVLWYEPERLYPGTHFHTVGSQNDQWLISLAGEDNIMWNLADEEAFRYYCDYLLNSMKENGITVYRQDFNFAPLAYWEYADENYYGGRKGITENHYVTNLYRY
ncbi:MAG: alpha-galactosidase, partial [Clostridia bacterium]|nr:alpha-galactosidase [Clostridia bacterium]